MSTVIGDYKAKFPTNELASKHLFSDQLQVVAFYGGMGRGRMIAFHMDIRKEFTELDEATAKQLLLDLQTYFKENP